MSATDAPIVGLAWKCHKRREWLFDLDAVREFAVDAGLKWPIMFGASEAGGRTVRTDGTHRIRTMMLPDGSTGPVHQITVRRTSTLERASRTMHHELAHAMQAERHGSAKFYDEAYARYSAPRIGSYGAAYRANPFEVEAREAEELHDAYPLTKAVRR